jgi:hypothetical protein
MSSTLLITPVLIFGDVKFIFDYYLQANSTVVFFVKKFPSHKRPYADVVKHNIRDTEREAFVDIATQF